jgi:hypothetical protein
MAGQQAELRAVFCEALEQKTPEKRAEYLDRACRGTPELRARVEALLQAHEEASGFARWRAEGMYRTARERRTADGSGHLADVRWSTSRAKALPAGFSASARMVKA